MLTSGLVDSEHLVIAGEILSLNLLGMTPIAADGRKALRNLALVLDPRKKRCEMLKIGAISFVLGFLVIGLLLLCFAFGLAITADVRGWGSFSVGSGLLTIFDYERTTEGKQTVIGTGTVVISLLAGLLNAVAGAMLWSRTPGRR